MDLYHNAIAFIYTSEYEGFGIPILEAYKADGLVMLNRKSCFPEVAGNAAIYFTLTSDESDIAERLEEVLGMSKEERFAQIQKQRERLHLYSWRKSAEQLSEVYRKIIRR